MKTLTRSQQIVLAGSALLTTLTALASFFSIIQLTLR
ncbi:hypothetical protein HRbin07_00355 [bacterium HR07]|nr:hypothetical protein HRbin07_00355 [bacterium HR07]